VPHLYLATVWERLWIGSELQGVTYCNVTEALPMKWSPLGSPSNITDYLNALKGNINRLVTARVRWQTFDELWAEDWATIHEKVLPAFGAGPSVVVIDCLSLFDPVVQARMDLLVDAIADKEDVFLLTFAPEVRSGLRDELMQKGKRFGGRLSVFDVAEPSPELVTLISQRLRDKERSVFVRHG